MQANVRLKPQEEVDKLKEKERKREEKELRKIAAAAGIKMPKPPAAAPVAAASTSAAVVPPTGGAPGMDIDGEPIAPKRSGWASISDTSAAAGRPGRLREVRLGDRGLSCQQSSRSIQLQPLRSAAITAASTTTTTSGRPPQCRRLRTIRRSALRAGRPWTQAARSLRRLLALASHPQPLARAAARRRGTPCRLRRIRGAGLPRM